MTGRLQVRFMADKIGESFDGVISGVTSFGLFVELLDHFISGAIEIARLKGDFYHYDEKNHRLIELGRKLSSSIEFRQPHQDYQHFNAACLIADRCGLIHRSLADRFEGTANFYAPVAARRELDFFTEVWERSESHPEFRRLYL